MGNNDYTMQGQAAVETFLSMLKRRKGIGFQTARTALLDIFTSPLTNPSTQQFIIRPKWFENALVTFRAILVEKYDADAYFRTAQVDGVLAPEDEMHRVVDKVLLEGGDGVKQFEEWLRFMDTRSVIYKRASEMLRSHPCTKTFFLQLLNMESHQTPTKSYFQSQPPPNLKSVQYWFSAAVLQFLKLDLNDEEALEFLSRVNEGRVMRHMYDARMLKGYFEAVFQRGGIHAMLALKGLFSLVTKYYMDVPDFYTKVYSLITPQNVELDQRALFFDLLLIFVSSSHISAGLVAAFIKRLSRLTLRSSPGVILAVIPLVYNLLRDHPQTQLLIDRTSDIPHDPYNEHERDPSKTNALESSLWEITSLKYHYIPAISKLGKLFESLQKDNLDAKAFFDETYETTAAAAAVMSYGEGDEGWNVLRKEKVMDGLLPAMATPDMLFTVDTYMTFCT